MATYTVATAADTGRQLATDITALGTGAAAATGGANGGWAISGTVNGTAATVAAFTGLSADDNVWLIHIDCFCN